MKRIVTIGGLVALSIIAAYFIIQQIKTEAIVALIVTVPEKPSPLDSLPIQKIKIPVKKRVLAANYYQKDENAPAIFICTGNGEALYEWLEVQKYLYEQGFSSFVFSYSGFGNSTGKTSSTSLFEDALAAYQQFILLTPNANKRFALSHSLGGTPLLGIANQLDPAPEKLIVHAAFSSIVELLIDLKIATSNSDFLWPNLWNNTEFVEDIELPILFVHSKKDHSVPFKHSQRLLEHAGENGSLLLLENYGHNAIYQNVSDSLYRPILEFIRK
ncbi:alpha/beta hydrolase [Algoriphagus lutimaris]|uniref:alpha/beta hydrolase n=1 Tax=Algoriphagus lutimaris TaxID=613197 RepID=UPI00196BB0CC|nr:alpha/beta fold hydrolase [Algoriphagus lutimaris]MBN3521076.1 alpha/beta hydrolase [Algoriphagus lutimaris]